MVGTDYPYSNFLPNKGTVVQIDERPRVLGRRAPTVLGLTGPVRPTPQAAAQPSCAKDGHHLLGHGRSAASKLG
jgi:thiamine pyrophosphate-dependent acetolactate synthase large subunit-like protein